MFPIIWAFVRSYAPVVMLPVAAVIGIIGYNIENIMSDKYTPFKPSIDEQREERLLKELNNTNCPQSDQQSQSSTHSLSERKFVPKTIFERNLSPQLMNDKK